MDKDNFDDIVITPELLKAISEAFVYYVRDGREEGQCIGMDYQNAFVYEPLVCASHDYIDSNDCMAYGFEEALTDAGIDEKRASKFVRASDDDATPAAQERRCVAWNEAWRMAREAGFSYFKAQVGLEVFKTLAPALLWPPERAEHARRYPEHVPSRISERDHAAQDLTDSIERDEVPAETLAAIAAAFRDKDEARLDELMDPFVRQEAAPAP